MSYPSQKRRLRPARGVAAAVAALLAGGAGLATLPSASAVPTVTDPAGTIKTMAGYTKGFKQGGYGPEETAANLSQFSNPRGLNFAPAGSPHAGDLYVTDALNHVVRRIDSAGVVHLVAGTAPTVDPTTGAVTVHPGNTGDNGPATSATLQEPHGVAVDSQGNVYIADSRNCEIRKVDLNGIITKFAGLGERKAGASDPLACAHSVQDPPTVTDPKTIDLDQPKQLFMTKEGTTDVLWVADMGNSMLRRIDIVGGVAQKMTRVAGVRQAISFSDGPVSTATLRHAEGIWVANDGTIYFTDGGNNLVRKISKPANPNGEWVVSTIAGDKATADAQKLAPGDLTGDDAGDGGLAINAHLDQPRGITGDNNGHLFVAEEEGSRIRRIGLDAQGNSTSIDTIAGDGTIAEQRNNGGSQIIKGENGPALQTQFNHLHDIQINSADGSLWMADSRDNRVRAVADAANAPGANIPTGGIVTPPPTQPSGNNGGGGGGSTTPVPGKSGYWMLGVEGRVYGFGDANNAMFGDASGQIPAGAKAVHIEPTPTVQGYWINDDRGGVYAFGDAARLGGIDSSQLQSDERVTSLSATPSGQGYWLFTSKGRVFPKGDAHSFGDLANLHLNGAIQSSIPTPSGNGYFMVGSDGGVFAFGDAVFRGSMGNVRLNQPVMALVPTRSNQGYWLVASDGGIFAFGDALFRGSMGATHLAKPVVGMVRYGNGYLMVGADGGIFSFSSDRPFVGSLGANPPARPIVFAATLDS
jgi:hypothetical protein